MAEKVSSFQRSASTMSVAEAWQWTLREFPFDGYVRPGRKSAYQRLVRELQRVVPIGARILDFGAGPGDKTAMFARVGYDVVAYDDFLDPWHKVEGNVAKIRNFADRAGVDYRVGPDPFRLIEGEQFDVVMLHHVLEHLHDSPRGLLLELLKHVRPGGMLYVTVPNAVNIRKRLAVLLGMTNYPPYPSFYWYPGPFRGHVREYVGRDLRLLAGYLDLDLVQLKSYFHFPQRIAPPLLGLLDACAVVAPGWRDSWMMMARRRADWRPETALGGAKLKASLGRGEYYDYSGIDDTAIGAS